MNNVYQGSLVEPRFTELSPEDITVKPGGIIVRPGLFREAAQAKRYADQVKNHAHTDGCVFCGYPEEKKIDIGESFSVIKAEPSYMFFGGRQLLSHELIIPDQHTDDIRKIGARALAEICSYVLKRQGTHPDSNWQVYMREPGNPSKSIEHVHPHLFQFALGKHALKTYHYSWHEGATNISFTDAIDLSPSLGYSEEIFVRNEFGVYEPDSSYRHRHFDGQQVLSLEIITPALKQGAGIHTLDTFSRAAIMRYVITRRSLANSDPSIRFQTQVVPSWEDTTPPHVNLFTLSLNPVTKVVYDRARGGVVDLEFGVLSPETIEEINKSRGGVELAA